MTTSTAVTRPRDVRDFLESPRMASELSAVAPRGTSPDTIARGFALALAENPDLRALPPAKFARAAIEATSLGIAPLHGHAYLIRYGKEVRFQLGYLGLIELARRSGKIRDVRAQVVREGDDFRYHLGLTPDLVHIPAGADGDVTHAYAVAHWTSGEVTFEVMTRAELDGIRARSQSPGKGPWATDYSEMCRKTAIRRLCKTLPMTPPPPTGHGGPDFEEEAGPPPPTGHGGPDFEEEAVARAVAELVEADEIPPAVDTATGELLDSPDEPDADEPADSGPGELPF